MRSGLLSDLAVIGYEISLEGNNIRYRYQKPGNPPDTVDPLIEELGKYKAEVVSILKTGEDDTVALTEKSQSRANMKAAWPSKDQSLLDWFLTLEAPTEPFYLEPHRHVVGPAKFFSALRMDITAGPAGPRAKMGSLQSDLRELKARLN
jgi:hypothetical protein